MTYQSVDELQKAMAKDVFHYTKDSKKAAGRALGTLVEIITFYLLKSWQLERNIAIERPIQEYMNPDITHNVEYSLHPSKELDKLTMTTVGRLTSNKILKESKRIQRIIKSPISVKSNQLLSKSNVLRNACTMGTFEGGFINSYLDGFKNGKPIMSLYSLVEHPFAIVECKRVGVEEGMKKGPQTIEKAKQGAYVARTVSSLQKIRMNNGEIGGIINLSENKIYYKTYDVLLKEVVNSNKKSLLKDFVLTVGVVSNHGNWFTSDKHNKELKVLAQSYDWLLFLTDKGLAIFIEDLILDPKQKYAAIKKAFLASYTGNKGKNQFTKVQISLEADEALQDYFNYNIKNIEQWFNIITPKNNSMNKLKNQLTQLSNKNWEMILK